MIAMETRVLNGLPVRVEAECSTSFDGEVEVEEMVICWNKRKRNGTYNRAMVIENKMTDNDWRQLEEEILEYIYFRPYAYWDEEDLLNNG